MEQPANATIIVIVNPTKFFIEQLLVRSIVGNEMARDRPGSRSQGQGTAQ